MNVIQYINTFDVIIALAYMNVIMLYTYILLKIITYIL